ncbi:hypothetical protein ASE36_21125 [Rhizobium sp. Root274]|nr:hypothetical protein ASC71_21185 [Rhizobium sp. Root1240]KRD26062.1 hypothetical protein ASE36_21125 [Rhizobium sp. Root274]
MLQKMFKAIPRALPPNDCWMIQEIAEKLKEPLRPEDLALLQNALERVCEIRGQAVASPQANLDAKILITLFQSGIRNRHQLVAMLTGQKFP